MNESLWEIWMNTLMIRDLQGQTATELAVVLEAMNAQLLLGQAIPTEELWVLSHVPVSKGIRSGG